MRGGEGLERGVAAVPARAEIVGQAGIVRNRLGILQMRGEQAEPAFVDFGGSGNAALCKSRGGDPALRGPAGVQKFCLGREGCKVDIKSLSGNYLPLFHLEDCDKG